MKKNQKSEKTVFFLIYKYFKLKEKNSQRNEKNTKFFNRKLQEKTWLHSSQNKNELKNKKRKS